MIEDKQLESLLSLPLKERLKLARLLIDGTVETWDDTADVHPGESPITNGLLRLAGRYAGGAGDASDRDETILENEVDVVSGLSVR